MPRDPKPAAARRRRNKQVADVELERQSIKRRPAIGKPPPFTDRNGLPLRDGAGEIIPRKWHPETQRWWRETWASPMSKVWMPSDVTNVRILALLVDDAVRGCATAAQLAAKVQLEDRLGLSPMGRRRLAWELGNTNPDADAAAPDPNDKPDEERFLRLVGS